MIIQFAAILAVLVEYRDRVSLKEVDLWSKVLIAFLPLLVVGTLLKMRLKLSLTNFSCLYVYYRWGYLLNS